MMMPYGGVVIEAITKTTFPYGVGRASGLGTTIACLVSAILAKPLNKLAKDIESEEDGISSNTYIEACQVANTGKTDQLKNYRTPLLCLSLSFTLIILNFAGQIYFNKIGAVGSYFLQIYLEFLKGYYRFFYFKNNPLFLLDG